MSSFESDSASDAESAFSDASLDFTPSSSVKSKGKVPLRDSTNTTAQPSAPATGDASDQYQKLSQLEHILKRPDTYIGSVEKTGVEMWSFDAATESMIYKEVHIVPGLYKTFDEIRVNAADDKIRDASMRNIKVNIDAENNTILVMNDGKGIPIEIHKKEKIYIPELIFGNLLTSSNYDDDEKKVTGGRNGYGAKLCNIFSTEFVLETADLNTSQVYKQTWTNNMANLTKPKITKLKSKKEYTKVTFKPDLSKFHMEMLDDDILSVLRRRVYDLCGTVKDCNIYLNDKKLSIRNFKSYVEMYVNAIRERSPDPVAPEGETRNYSTIVHEVFNDRWEVAFAVSDGSFNQVSFVNSIATTSGGTHVKYVSDQIITKLIDALTKKEKGKKKLNIKPQEVRNNMFVFINCLIENPAFTSQTKEQLTTRVAQFGGKPLEKIVISDQFIAKILKTSIADKIRTIVNANEDKEMLKADGSRKSRIKNQVKLVDANKAGTKEGYKCTLILTEGDSAIPLAVAGLTVVGRDYYGCFPLRGKLLNVREASIEQVSKNAEINSIKQIMGLQHKKRYTPENIKSLRYGHIMIMTDQDQDGSHIKGLIINFLETSFPGLLEIPGFLLEFITPIVKVTITGRGNHRVIPFYNMPEFEKWRETEGTTCKWKHKYFKGLGTSLESEGREYFAALDRHMKSFHALQDGDSQYIDMAFSKKKADERKDWLQAFRPGTHLDPQIREIPISEFINKELILFSMADNVRSIPSILDGFKPGQRKVLYGCFKRNLRSEIKVAQLVGYISEHTGYHHGEGSLAQTIVGLAQNFVGANNLNLLQPIGLFGSRAAGGKDFSAVRYIHTNITDLTRVIFNPLDDDLYTYVQDDAQTVEPEAYLPIIPMLLVNGAEGIGTGWSTNIPSFNPVDIVANIRRMMNGEEPVDMTPWFKGWEGDLERISPEKYKVLGKIEQVDDDTVEITEIPIKTWTNSVKEFLLAGLGNDKPWIKDMEEQHGINIRFVVRLLKEEMDKSLRMGLLERFKLISSISLSNMVAFDPQGRIKKYSSANEILKDYYWARLELYQRRKDMMAENFQNQLTRLSEQARFIKLIIEKKLTIANKKRLEMVDDLKKLKFTRFNKNGKPVHDEPLVEAEELAEEEEEAAGDISQLNLGLVAPEDESQYKPETTYSQYDYLLGMAIWSLTRERYEKLLRQRDEKQEELNELLKKSAKDLWNSDLDDFLVGWEEFLRADIEARNSFGPTAKTSTRKRARKSTKSEPAQKKTKSSTPKASTPTIKAEATPAQPVVKEETNKQPDLLSFFSKEPSVAKTVSAAPPKRKTPKSKPKKEVVSLFSDSSDDDITLFSVGDAKPTPKPSTNNILDELEDLKSSTFTPKVGAAGRRRPKSYALAESDGNESDEDYMLE